MRPRGRLPPLLSTLILVHALSAAGGAEKPPEETAAGAAGDSAGESAARPPVFTTLTIVGSPLESLTASVTVIDGAAIDASGARTVGELLAWAPGVHAAGSGTRGGLTAALVRGGDPNFTLVLLDGVPLNDATDVLGGTFNLESLPAVGIERVEVVRGPSSHLHGSSALAGVINVITRDPGSDRPPARIEAEAGDASLKRAAGVTAAASGKTAGLLGLAWDEERERIADESFRQLSLHANLDHELGPGSNFALRARFSDWQTADYPEASGGPVYGPGDLRRSDHRALSVRGELVALAPSGARQQLSASHFDQLVDRKSPGVAPLVPPSVEETRFIETHLRWIGTVLTGERLSLGAGVDVGREEGRNQSLLLLPPAAGGAIPGDYRLTRERAGIFVEVIARRGRSTFEASLRQDFAEGFGAEWGGRAGVARRLRSDRTLLRASAGRAVKLPSFFALASPAALGGNSELRPETSAGLDLGVEHRLLDGRVRVGLTLFALRFEELIDFDFDRFLHVNRSEVRSRGAELLLDWRPDERWQVEANVTWNEVEDRLDPQPLRQRPKLFGGVRVRLRPVPDLSIWLDATALSRSFDRQIPVPGRDSVGGYGVVGLAASWRLNDRIRLRARIDNLANERFETAIGFPGPGRSIRIGVRAAARRRPRDR